MRGGIPASWGLGEALARHPGLALVPSSGTGSVLIEGELKISATGPEDVLIDETYAVRMEVPRDFPRAFPRVFETGGRVPKAFHRNPDRTLCLGSPLALALEIARNPTIGEFIGRAIIPYLYSHAFHERFGHMPFGELAHGVIGLDRELRRIFRLPRTTIAEEFLRMASLSRRQASKQPCPCGSGIRLGRCHSRSVNGARATLSRAGCRQQLSLLTEQRRSERETPRVDAATSRTGSWREPGGFRPGASEDRMGRAQPD